jgi:hypothetical protein
MASSRTGCGPSSCRTIRSLPPNIFGLYVDPPEHALVLSVDEKLQRCGPGSNGPRFQILIMKWAERDSSAED